MPGRRRQYACLRSHRARDARSVRRTFLLQYGLLAAFAHLFADMYGLESRFVLAVVGLPRMAWAQKGPPVHIFLGHLAFTVTE